MTIVYQGESVETATQTVAEFLRAHGVEAASSVVEYKGEVYGAETGFDLSLEDGATLNVFHIVAGG